MILSIKNKIKTNPLYIWRKKKSIGKIQLAIALGVSLTTIYMWEIGATMPTDEHLEQLTELTGIEDLAPQWSAWYEMASRNINPNDNTKEKRYDRN